MQSEDISSLVGAFPICPKCQSSNVVRDAWSHWDRFKNEWVIKTVFDHAECDDCGAEITISWKIDKEFRTARIRRLNNAMRRGEVTHGSIVMTQGVQALGEDAQLSIVKRIAEYDAFWEDNDPHGEADFGDLKHDDQKVFFKIDYYDLDLKGHSPDAANPDVTHRVLTIMLAQEY